MNTSSANAPPVAGECIPKALHIIGRQRTRENADICGQYFLVGSHSGHPMYQNRINGIAIRFWKPLARWVIDRPGARDKGVAVAYASGPSTCIHPAHPGLTWHVWENASQAHVADTEIIAVDAPACFIFVGRDPMKENSIHNGRYCVAGVVNGRPTYKHEQEESFVHFNVQENRWLVSRFEDIGSTTCSVWADAGTSKHPGDLGLQWQFWEPAMNAFALDQKAGFVDAPDEVHVLSQEESNAIINGTYHIAGVHEHAPLYMKPGTQTVIRYSSKKDWWVIDCDGLQLSKKASLLSRLYQWAVNAHSEPEDDRCAAFSIAHGAQHPGRMDLKWNVWDSSNRRHNLDSSVMATSAPRALEVSGRNVRCENGDINGLYGFAGSVRDRPIYRKLGSELTIYFSKYDKWVLSRHGVCEGRVFVAHSGDHIGADNPQSVQWHIWETDRGAFQLDPRVCAAPSTLREPSHAHQATPLSLQKPIMTPAATLPLESSVCLENKRHQCSEHDTDHLGPLPKMKKARLANLGVPRFTPLGA